MTWIKTISAEEDERVRHAIAAQRALYPSEYGVPVHPTADGGSSQIVASHSLIPDALRHALSTFGALMSPDLPLTRQQHEMITTSQTQCDRCLGHYDARQGFDLPTAHLPFFQVSDRPWS